MKQVTDKIPSLNSKNSVIYVSRKYPETNTPTHLRVKLICLNFVPGRGDSDTISLEETFH